MEEKKSFINKKTFMIFYVCILLAFCIVEAVFPRISKDILIYEEVETVCLVLFGFVILLQAIIFPIMNKTWSVHPLKTTVSMVVAGLLVVLLVFGGITHFFDCLKDAKQGVTYVTLKNTSIEYESSTRSYSPNHSYYLKGYAGLEKMSFRVRASDVEKNIRQIISEDAPDILVIYYPNTKKLVQLQIELEDGSVLVLPKGEKRLERYVQ